MVKPHFVVNILPMKDDSKFLARISIDTSGCWFWKGASNKDGYGVAQIDGKRSYAHRRSFIIFNGPISPGKYICHSCDVPRCVNPDHLWEGTALENNRDTASKKRHQEQKKTHCRLGHELTAENTLLISKGAGRNRSRKCLACWIAGKGERNGKARIRYMSRRNGIWLRKS